MCQEFVLGSTLETIENRKALKHFDRGINILPNNEDLLIARSLCRMKLGDPEGAERDWTRLKELCFIDSSSHTIKFLANSVEE